MDHAQSRDYFERRAAEEHAAAEQSQDERVAHPHRELARRYEDLIRSDSDGIPALPEQEQASTLPAEFRILP